jgi:hypothetical protein
MDMLRPLVDAAQERAAQHGGQALDEALGAARAALEAAPAQPARVEEPGRRFA